MARRESKLEDSSLSKTCFVICPIGNEGSKERDWSNTVLDFIIKPVVEKYGYNAIRADHISAPGRITNQIVEKLINSELVIADLSSSNPNVFYELAVRHATKKPCIQMIKNGEGIPFDTRENRTIFFDVHVREAEKAKKDLESQVKSVEEGHFEIDNPIRSSLDLMKILESGKPKEIESARIFDQLSKMQFQIQNLSVKLEKQSNEDTIKRVFQPELEETMIEYIKIKRMRMDINNQLQKIDPKSNDWKILKDKEVSLKYEMLRLHKKIQELKSIDQNNFS